MRTSSRRFRLASALGISTLLMATAACSSSEETAGSSESSTATTSAEQPAVPANPSPTWGPQEVDAASAALVPAELRGTTLEIPMIVGNPPMTFADEGGKLVGFNEDMADAVMDVLGLEHEFVKVQFDTIIPGLQSGRYQVTFVSLNPSEERLQVVDMVPYSTTSASLVTKADYAETLDEGADLCGRKIAAVTASSQYNLLVGLDEECKAEGNEPIDITQLPGLSEATLAVKSGQAEAFAIAGTYASYMAAADDTIKVQPFKFGSALSGVATPKDSELADAIASAFNVLIANGTYGEILEAWNVGDIALDSIQVLR